MSKIEEFSQTPSFIIANITAMTAAIYLAWPIEDTIFMELGLTTSIIGAAIGATVASLIIQNQIKNEVEEE